MKIISPELKKEYRMKNQIKIGIKLWKHGLCCKTNIATAILFLLIGLAMELSSWESSYLGGFYLVLSPMIIAHLIISTDVSTMVQTSPYKKKIQTSMPVLVCTPGMLAAYTVVVLFSWHRLHVLPGGDIEGAAAVRSHLISVIVLLFFAAVYMGVCYKYFLVSVLLLTAILVPLIVISQYTAYVWADGMPTAAIVAFGYLAILAGQFLSYLCSCLFYKKELSRNAFGSAMRREAR
jgi:hypothetical protein